ncbi:hypothetical protein GOODEAATRI_011607 [Goodea atripinnis]|uniref:Transducer of regulated CREB activity C-terminal domain-containing protein n=1 Tax=Goodea atripinnis TaxID=208336 RepID=A0ABV0PX90_9TELE
MYTSPRDNMLRLLADQLFTHAFMQFYFAQLQLQKTQYLQLGQNRGQYYGGSLPNVNQIGNGNIDLPFQSQMQTRMHRNSCGMTRRYQWDSNSTGSLTTNLTHLGISAASHGITTPSQPSMTVTAQRRQPPVVPLTLTSDLHLQQSPQQLSPTVSSPVNIAQLTPEAQVQLLRDLQKQPVLPQGIQLIALPTPASSGTATANSPSPDSQTTASMSIGSLALRQTNALSHQVTQTTNNRRQRFLSSPCVCLCSASKIFAFQLEQFNMIESPISSSSLFSQCSTLNYTQAAMMGLTGSSLQDSQQLNYSSHGNIPNIILTGESPPSLSKELTNSLAGVGDVSFDADSQFPLDELKIDPLTLDGLHMLNDPDMVLTDPATEDTFRMDRL